MAQRLVDVGMTEQQLRDRISDLRHALDVIKELTTPDQTAFQIARDALETDDAVARPSPTMMTRKPS
jgi:hypothetical protein